MPSQQRPWGLAFGLTGCGLLMTVGLLLFLRHQQEQKKKAGGPAADPPERDALPAHVLTAQQLFEDFDSAPESAERRYKGKLLEVSGRVAAQRKDERGRYSILEAARQPSGLESFEETWERIARASASGFEGVACYPAQGAVLPAEGSTVTVRGRCEGMPRNIVLSGCRRVR
jgi:hypothetical protein